MSVRVTLATTRRILRQLSHDPRTLGLLVLVPSVLMGLLRWLLGSGPAFDHIGPPLLALFPFVVMFLVTSVATLRERTSGTLERLLAMPMGRLDLILGYALAFGLVTLLQVGLVSWLSLSLFGLHVAGSVWLLLLVALLDAWLGTALGLFLSAFATTEFQAVQFMPAVVLPQALLCGLVVPRDRMPDVLKWISDAMPLSYAVDAMGHVAASTSLTGTFLTNLAIVAGCVVLALLLGAVTLRRRSR